jgi:hypothetical protein
VSSDTSQIAPISSGLTGALSTDESRLALLGVVDFEGDWEALAAAPPWVVDGPTKANLIRGRLAPAAAEFTSQFAAEVKVLDLLAARHWFATQPCRKGTPARHAGEQKPAAASLTEDGTGTQQARP